MGAMLLSADVEKHRGHGPLLTVACATKLRSASLATPMLPAQYSTRTRNVPSMAAIASRRLVVCSSSAVTSMTT